MTPLQYAAVYLGELDGRLRAHACLHKVKRKPRFHVTKVARYVAANRERVAKALYALFKEWSRKASAAAFDVLESYEQKLERAVTKDPSEQLLEDVLDALGLDSMSTDIADELETEMVKAFRKAGVDSMRTIMGTVPKDLIHSLDLQAKQYASERGAELVGTAGGEWSITQTTRAQLRDLIEDAVDKGWSPAKLSDEIEDSFAFSEGRADTIARTELAMAHVQGNVEGWRQTGLVERKISLLGDRHAEVDDCDENAEAGPVDLDDDFPSGDDFPPYHPNCVCDVEPVLADEDDEKVERAFSEDQPRDEHGRWTSGAYQSGGKYSENLQRIKNAQPLGPQVFDKFYDQVENAFGRGSSRYQKVLDAIKAHQSSTSHSETNPQVRKYLDRAFKRAGVVLESDAITYRGLHLPEETMKKLDEAAGKSGRVYIQQNKNRYVPTTTSMTVAQDFGMGGAILRVYLPKGTRVLGLANYGFHSEQEVTLNRGARFRVVQGRKLQVGGTREYTVEYVGGVHNKKGQLGKVAKAAVQDRQEHFSGDIEHIEIDGEVIYGEKE